MCTRKLHFSHWSRRPDQWDDETLGDTSREPLSPLWLPVQTTLTNILTQPVMHCLPLAAMSSLNQPETRQFRITCKTSFHLIICVSFKCCWLNFVFTCSLCREWSIPVLSWNGMKHGINVVLSWFIVSPGHSCSHMVIDQFTPYLSCKLSYSKFPWKYLTVQ